MKVTLSHHSLLDILGCQWLVVFDFISSIGVSLSAFTLSHSHQPIVVGGWHERSGFLWVSLSGFFWVSLSGFLWVSLSGFLWVSESGFLWVSLSGFLWVSLNAFTSLSQPSAYCCRWMTWEEWLPLGVPGSLHQGDSECLHLSLTSISLLL